MSASQPRKVPSLRAFNRSVIVSAALIMKSVLPLRIMERSSCSSPSATPISISRPTPCSSNPLQVATLCPSTSCWPQAATETPDPTTTTTCPLASSLWSCSIWLGDGLICLGSQGLGKSRFSMPGYRAPHRTASVGQGSTFWQCATNIPAAGIQPA